MQDKIEISEKELAYVEDLLSKKAEELKATFDEQGITTQEIRKAKSELGMHGKISDERINKILTTDPSISELNDNDSVHSFMFKYIKMHQLMKPLNTPLMYIFNTLLGKLSDNRGSFWIKQG